MTTLRTTAALLGAVVLGCAPALDGQVPRGYLARATPVAAGTPGGRLGQDVWHLVLGRVQVARPLCSDLACRRRELWQALQRAASAGAVGALVAPEDSDLLDPITARAIQQELGLAALPTEQIAAAGAPDVMVLRLEPAAPGARTGSWREQLQQASADGATLILRHPCAQGATARALLDDPALLELLDAVEIDGPPHVDSGCARSRWQRWLRQGRALVGLAAGEAWLGLDGEPLHHLNLVRATDGSAAGLLRGLASGRVQLIHAPGHRPRLQIGADLDGDGRTDEAQQGDRLTLLDDVVEVQIRVIGGRGSELLLFTEIADGPVERLAVDDSDQVLAVRYPVPTRGSGFVRAELHRGGDLLVISNPLFVTRAQVRAPGS